MTRISEKFENQSSPFPSPSSSPKVAVITCAVLEDEVRHFVRDQRHIVHVEMVEQGLHNTPDKLRSSLQEIIRRVEDTVPCDVIVLGYGICSRGTVGVFARRCRLVIPRAHDCITLLLGSKERYSRYVADNPGTYWYSPGWNRCHTPPGKERYDKLFKEYVEKYGEDNAQFLMETEQSWMKEYNRAAYVDVGVGDTPEDVAYTQKCAQWLGWSFDHQKGSPKLLQDLLTGPWDPEAYCVLEPGETIRMTTDERVIEPEAVPANHSPTAEIVASSTVSITGWD